MTPQKNTRRKNNNSQPNPNFRHASSNSQSHLQSYQIQASDYESEAYIPPTTEKRTNEEINFSVLQRYIPNLQSIISIAPSTQIYTFSPETHTWEKTNTEGTLFVCELTPSPLTGAPQHCVMVLNRRGMENLIIETREIENVEITEQFLLVTLSSQGELKTLGFYMYDDKTETKAVNCQQIMKLWEAAMNEREQEGELAEKYGLNAEQGEEMARGLSMSGQRPMGRKLSLTELFGQR